MSAAKAWTVRIYRMVRGADSWLWLCARCLHAMKAEGWSQGEAKDPPHELACDGPACKAERKTAAATAERRAA